MRLKKHITSVPSVVFLLAVIVFLTDCKDTQPEKTYKPTWESNESHPLPQWYDDSKFGIFIHWGVYSVPA